MPAFVLSASPFLGRRLQSARLSSNSQRTPAASASARHGAEARLDCGHPRLPTTPLAQGELSSNVFRVAHSAFVMACAVSAGAFLPLSRGGQQAARASESAVNVLAGSQVSRRAVTHNSLRQAAGAPVLRVLPGSVAMASAPAGITSKSAVAAASSKFHTRRFSIQDRVMYSVSEFLMWNSGARVLALLALAIVFIYIGSLVFARLDPDGLETNESPFWMAARSYLNPLEDDYRKNSLRVLSVTMATCGMVFFGILVGMVTEAVESGIAAADGGSARVVAAKHTLICGWNHNTPKIITDINAVSGDRKIVVLVAESEKETMMEELRQALSEDQQKRISVSVRTGTPVLSRDLEKVAASRADKIILSAGRGVSTAESDRRILSRALALRANIPLFSGDIVAELSSSRDETILQSIFESTRAKSVECVSTERLLFRFIAQAVRQVGLADCVAELMGENRSTVFHVLPLIKAAPNLVGMNFHDVRPTAIPGAIIAGFVDPRTGKVVIAGGGGSVSHALSAQTEILLLGVPSTRQASIASSSASASATDQSASKRVTRRPESSRRSAENILVCGWRSGTMKDFLTELDSILPRGSSVTIVDDDAPDLSKKSVASELKMENIALSTVLHNPDDYSTLEQVLGSRRKAFDHVLVMSSALGQDSSNGEYSGVEEDSKALTTLCYIHDLLGKRHDGGALTTVTVEFVNELVAEIARANKSVANVILPHSLSAHIAAQTCRDSRLNGVFSEILSQDGKEVYLRPVSTYLPQATGGLASFATISTDAASERDEIVLGFISKGETVLNPAGNMRFGVRAWSPDDRIVVLAD